jgi:GNAT superfamily N-acetyltransferase
MLFTFSMRKKGFDAVIVQPWFVSHVNGFDLECAARRAAEVQECHPEKIVESVAKGSSSRLALAFHPGCYIIIECHGCSDAHDAYELSSGASSTRMSVVFRPAEEGDLDAMASIRAREWETEAYWKSRIGSYMTGEQSPQQAFPARAVFVAVDDGQVVGFVAGHRTRRYGCDGELEWINVVPERRGAGIAGQLLVVMASWFVEQGALRVCVDVEPKNYDRAGTLRAVWRRAAESSLDGLGRCPQDRDASMTTAARLQHCAPSYPRF